MEMLTNLHKAANIIYKYDNANKKILFIGFPISFKHFLKNSKHILIPEFFWFNGMLSNSISFIKSFKRQVLKNISKTVLKLRKKLDLIVVNNLDKNSTLIKEGSSGKIPVVNFKTFNIIKNNNMINNRLVKDHFFFAFVKTVLNKAISNKSKKVQNYQNFNQLQLLYKKNVKFSEKRKNKMVKKNTRSRILYKKFLKLKLNPLANNKFLKIKTAHYDYKDSKTKKGFSHIEKFKKEKWKKFLDFLKKTNRVYRKFKPYKIYSYEAFKFSGQGNSFKKRFKNDLTTKKIFYYVRGGVKEKYLKNTITKIYNCNKYKNLMRISIEFFESRLDSVLYKSKFSYSIKNAQQLISHKHIKVNNKIEKNKSYILKQGDSIQINLKSLKIIQINLFRQLKDSSNGIFAPAIPNYLIVNYKTLEIIFGNIKSFDFSSVFTFKFNMGSLFTMYY